ncbi:hypothetical protein ABT270_07495 [Streptomyces sp900105245]|uniref:hypothetical protein n=1 Tax=Streptomyces sp. 900105245 TaxID=3154379 RepID=UPI0033182225
MTSAAARIRLPGQVTAIAAAFLVSCLGDGLAITALMLDFHDRATGGLGIAALFGAMSVPAILLAGYPTATRPDVCCLPWAWAWSACAR